MKIAVAELLALPPICDDVFVVKNRLFTPVVPDSNDMSNAPPEPRPTGAMSGSSGEVRMIIFVLVVNAR